MKYVKADVMELKEGDTVFADLASECRLWIHGELQVVAAAGAAVPGEEYIVRMEVVRVNLPYVLCVRKRLKKVVTACVDIRTCPLMMKER